MSKSRPKPSDAKKESPIKRRKRELLLDLELEGTFPASDPPSSTQPVHPSVDETPKRKEKR